MRTIALRRLAAAATVLAATAGVALTGTTAANAVPAGTTDAPAAVCSTTGAPADDPTLCASPDDLVDVRIGDVHPTQPSLGFDEVYYKLGRYSSELSKDGNPNKEFGDWCEANGQTDAVSAQAGATLRDPSTFTCETPLGDETADSIAAMKTVVIGPGGTLYLTDGHHTLTSFAETPDGGLDTHVRLRVLGNLSGLSDADFWSTMQANKWVWLRDVNGDAITPAQLPKNVGLANFEDDRARSIMYFARDIGYSADGAVPFQEFYWGSWLRAQKDIDLAGWDQDDWASSLALVEQITRAQVAIPQDQVVDTESGYTAADLSTFTDWNQGDKAAKGEFGKLSKPYTDTKPGKLAYMTAYRALLAAAEPTPTPSDPSTTPTPTPSGTPTATPTSTPSGTPGATPTAGATTPTLQVSGALKAGATITVRGTGFAPSTSGIRIEIHSDPVLLGTVTSDGTGAFTLTATVPASLPAGAHTVVAIVNGVQIGSAPFTLTAAGDPAALAFTGSNGVGAMLTAGIVVVMLGAGATVIARRRMRNAGGARD